jgi:hypothetical protein
MAIRSLAASRTPPSMRGNCVQRRKWLKVALLLMLAGASFACPMNPQEIEELMRIMNGNQVAIPDEDHKGDEGRDVPG